MLCSFFFFFNDTATTEIYTLSLHDALPICRGPNDKVRNRAENIAIFMETLPPTPCNRVALRTPGEGTMATDKNILMFQLRDRKSTRLNSSHANISYAVFCLKKKKKYKTS